MYTIKSSGMFTRPRWYFNLMITRAQRLGMLDHITTTTTVYLKSKRQNVSISYMRLKEIHSLVLALFIVHVLIDSSSLCHVFAYTNPGVFLFGLVFYFFFFKLSSLNFLYFTCQTSSNQNFMCKNFEFLYEKCIYDCGVWKYFEVEMTIKKTVSEG